jgi:hypothetical protein
VQKCKERLQQSYFWLNMGKVILHIQRSVWNARWQKLTNFKQGHRFNQCHNAAYRTKGFIWTYLDHAKHLTWGTNTFLQSQMH